MAQLYNRRPQGLRGALSELGINFEGREHSGLCDARNTAHLAWRIVQDGGVLKITTNINTTHFLLGNTANVANVLEIRKTPDVTKQSIPSSTCKKTPPLCNCGRRAMCKIANLPGPNQGCSIPQWSRVLRVVVPLSELAEFTESYFRLSSESDGTIIVTTVVWSTVDWRNVVLKINRFREYPVDLGTQAETENIE
uniref:(California timema) hypothetical protein n=1 Tax=Timema californicum TaxID=61474 RepID=A0A7R9J9A0_TIMCA|nr:unnamed protein product [Timema californicum]